MTTELFESIESHEVEEFDDFDDDSEYETFFSWYMLSLVNLTFARSSNRTRLGVKEVVVLLFESTVLFLFPNALFLVFETLAI